MKEPLADVSPQQLKHFFHGIAVQNAVSKQNHTITYI
jgi:hypothetical protein